MHVIIIVFQTSSQDLGGGVYTCILMIRHGLDKSQNLGLNSFLFNPDFNSHNAPKLL